MDSVWRPFVTENFAKKTSSYKWSLHLVSFSRDTFSILDVSDAAVKPSKSKNHVLINN